MTNFGHLPSLTVAEYNTMKPHSRRLIHIGLNFIIVPPPQITRQTYLLFQQAVVSQGLEYQNSEFPGNQIILVRTVPSPFQISVGTPDKQVGQVLIVAPELVTPIDTFIDETKAALAAFEDVWPTQHRQIIHGDATIRELYETTSEHAFQELWENRLGQSTQTLAAFGKPLLGGGLRFVMAPTSEEIDPVQIEVKIESWLRDSSKIFVETQFAWNSPSTQFQAAERLTEMNKYIESKVRSFITGENS
jgi:hypothetical protein